MAITNEKSAEFSLVTSVPPVMVETHKWHGRLRVAYFKHTQGAAAGDAGSTAELVRLPAGKIRVLTKLSLARFSDFGAARTLDFGTRAFVKDDGLQTAVAQSAQRFVSAVAATPAGQVLFDEADVTIPTILLESQGGVDVYATVAGGTWPVGAVVEGYVVYVID